MRQDIIPYRQIRQNRHRSAVRPVARRPVTVFRLQQTESAPIKVVEIDTYIFEPAPMTRPIEALSSEEKVMVLERALLRARQSMKAERRRKLRRIII